MSKKYQSFFSGKNKENLINILSAELAHSMLVKLHGTPQHWISIPAIKWSEQSISSVSEL